MACAQSNLPFPRPIMEADVCLVDHVQTTSIKHGHSGVNIREFEDSIINPDPVIQNEETEQLMEDYLSPQKLKCLTGINDLQELLFLEMVVNTTQNSLGNFGNMVKNLRQLKLSNSIIASVRDLGTSLANLQTLWMAKCGLTDLDGISSLCSIKELYLAYNDITDVSPLSMLDTLEILDLEGNLVEDMAQVEFLVLCPELKRLTLEGNPVCMKPHPDCSAETLLDYNYRAEVHKALPKLKYLDDEPFLFDLVNGAQVLKITPSQQQHVNLREKLKSDWELVTERIKAFDLEEQATESSREVADRPGTSHGSRPMTASIQRPASASRRRPGTARQRPGTASGERPGSGGVARPSTAIGERDVYEVEDDSSDLTHGYGAVICGNPSRALKARRKKMSSTVENSAEVNSQSLIIHDENLEKEVSQRDLFEELTAWRREYSRVFDNRIDLTIVEDEDEACEESPTESDSHSPLNNTSSSLSPTPPQRPISQSPPSSASSRRRVARIRKSYPIPTPPEEPHRPRTAAEFRNHALYRHKSSDARLRATSEGSTISNDQNISKEVEVSSSDLRANSAAAKTSGLPRHSPSSENNKIINATNPVISASRELKKPRVDPRLLSRIRPSTARSASQRNQNLF